MANFELEKKAVEYCAEHGIDLFDPVRGQVITAFCIGAKIEREACAKACEEQTEGFAATSTWDEAALSCARAIRMRSNVKVRGPEAALSPEAPSRLTGCATEVEK